MPVVLSPGSLLGSQPPRPASSPEPPLRYSGLGEETGGQTRTSGLPYFARAPKRWWGSLELTSGGKARR
jgi:hypothetical protein